MKYLAKIYFRRKATNPTKPRPNNIMVEGSGTVVTVVFVAPPEVGTVVGVSLTELF